VVQGQGLLPGGGGKPLAFASAVHNATAGFALDGKPDLAVVPWKDPTGKEDCIPTIFKQKHEQGKSCNKGRLTEPDDLQI
jgi:hypothetical protein